MELEFRRFRHYFSEQQSPKAERSQLLQHLRGNREKVALRLGIQMFCMGSQNSGHRPTISGGLILSTSVPRKILDRTDQVLSKISNEPIRVRVAAVRT
jgi:hypothetical protein